MITFQDFLNSSKRKLSEDQMKVVNSNIATIVSAGAGSGKTTVLSYRFMRLVLEKRAHVDEILTLTFTKKASSEMYERIYTLINDLSKQDEELGEEMKRFAQSYISTLDSFSSEVARTDSARYGISRDFEVMDDDEERELVSSIVKRLFETHKEVMLPLARIFMPTEIESDLLLNLARKTTVLTDYNAEAERTKFLDFLDRIEKVCIKQTGEIFDQIDKLANAKNAKFFSPDKEYYANRYCYVKGLYFGLQRINLRGFTHKNYTEVRELAKEYNEIYSILNAIKENREADKSYFEAFALFISTLNSEKRRLGKLKFSDISDLALTILKENKTVRNYYKKKFKYIMIDEFQDNSEEQRDLLYLLSEKENEFNPGVPRKEMLDNTKLFFVGDDKQSIYAFRGADVSVFNSLKDEIAQIGGVHLTMSENYRSEPGLIDHFNKVFPEVMVKAKYSPQDKANEEFFESMKGEKFPSFEAEFDSVKARDKKVDSKIVIAISDNLSQVEEEEKIIGDDIEIQESDDAALLNNAENEAEFIVSYIENVITKSEEFMLPTKDGGKRYATYSDIAVLFRSGKSQLPIEKALRRERIPYTALSTSAVTVEAITYDMEAFISLLLFPMDKRSYINVLRSPFARLSDDSIFSLSSLFESEELKGEPFTERDMVDFLDQDKMDDLREFYLDLKESVGRLSAEKILDRLYYESGYSAYIESKMSLSSYKQHYEYLWEEAKKSEDLYSFWKFLKANEGKEVKMDKELLRLNTGGVNLLNIHKSKGLEFPIVILAGSNTGRKGEKTPFIIDNSWPKFLALDLSVDKMLNKKVYQSFKKRREEAEQKRLFYVALTRAENHLVVVASGDKIKEKSFYYYYVSPLSKDKSVEHVTFKTLSESEIENNWESPNSFEEFYEKETPPRGVYVEEKEGVKERGHKDDENYDIEEDYEILPEFGSGVDAIISEHGLYSEFGTLLHDRLESYFKKVSHANYKSNILTDKEINTLENEADRVLDNFVSSPFYKENIEGKETLSEERFYTLSEDGKLLEGSIDLLVLGKDYNLVVDYKSDKQKNPEYHKAQITSYVKTAESLYGKKCYGTLLYLRSMESGPLWDKNGEAVKEI